MVIFTTHNTVNAIGDVNSLKCLKTLTSVLRQHLRVILLEFNKKWSIYINTFNILLDSSIWDKSIFANIECKANAK